METKRDSYPNSQGNCLFLFFQDIPDFDYLWLEYPVTSVRVQFKGGRLILDSRNGRELTVDDAVADVAVIACAGDK